MVDGVCWALVSFGGGEREPAAAAASQPARAGAQPGAPPGPPSGAARPGASPGAAPEWIDLSAVEWDWLGEAEGDARARAASLVHLVEALAAAAPGAGAYTPPHAGDGDWAGCTALLTELTAAIRAGGAAAQVACVVAGATDVLIALAAAAEVSAAAAPPPAGAAGAAGSAARVPSLAYRALALLVLNSGANYQLRAAPGALAQLTAALDRALGALAPRDGPRDSSADAAVAAERAHALLAIFLNSALDTDAHEALGGAGVIERASAVLALPAAARLHAATLQLLLNYALGGGVRGAAIACARGGRLLAQVLRLVDAAGAAAAAAGSEGAGPFDAAELRRRAAALVVALAQGGDGCAQLADALRARDGGGLLALVSSLLDDPDAALSQVRARLRALRCAPPF
jgi:hypothetical protein